MRALMRLFQTWEINCRADGPCGPYVTTEIMLSPEGMYARTRGSYYVVPPFLNPPHWFFFFLPESICQQTHRLCYLFLRKIMKVLRSHPSVNFILASSLIVLSYVKPLSSILAMI